MSNFSNLTSKLSPRELIQSVFSTPFIGSTCTPAAEELCMKNNLNFVNLIQPFCKLTSEAHFRDSTAGVSVSVRGLRLNVCDVDWRPPQTLLARKMLNEAVSNHVTCDEMKSVKLSDGTITEVSSNNPWFEEWREIFFAMQFPSDHEFTRHLLACLIVISSSDTNPVEQANQLTKKVRMMQSITPPKLPKWIAATPDEALNCYIMLHDGSSGDISKAQQAFDNLKATFGDNRCFLIQINSLKDKPNLDQTDLWIKYLTKSYQKHETSSTGESNSESASKTPQETCLLSNADSGSEIFHPLSPIKEGIPEITTPNSMSSSANGIPESSTPQKINPNVWANEPTEVIVPHGAWLASSDIDNLKHFIQDFSIRALIPYVEKVVGLLNDSITNKKSVSKSLLGATKRWFNTNKPIAGGVPTTAVIYSPESTELQIRKLGDLYFMFGNYSLAFQAYHQAKRDFYADSAWQFYAGALEMAALSAFMSGTASKKTQDYMEEAITTYLTVCKLPHLATRATLLSIECLKSANQQFEAAKQLTRMTSEDADLRSALLLEQAAYCYLLSQPSYYRKYSFHSVLSGHRYTKAGQRKHAFRMYLQSEKVIYDRGWDLAEDHIEYTISKQAIMLKKLDDAGERLSRLLRPSSLQNSQQQAIFLREYLITKKTLISQSSSAELMTIALPCLVQNSVRVLVTSAYPENYEDLIPASNIDIMGSLNETWMWNKLEEMVSTHHSRKQPIMIFKPSKNLFTSEFPSVDHPLSIFGEPINIAFVLKNPIKPSIIFEKVTLLWEFKKDTGELFSNRNAFVNDQYVVDSSVINCTIIESMEFGEYEKKVINMKISSNFLGYLRIVGIAGRVSSSVDKTPIWGKLNFEKIHVPLDATKKDYDRKLEIQVLPPVSALHVRFTSIPKEVLNGEIFPITITLTNVGSNEIEDVYMITDNPRLFTIEPQSNSDIPLSLEKDVRDFSSETFSKDREARRQYVTKIIDSRDSDIKPILSNETRRIEAFIQAPHNKGPKLIKILIYYSVPENYPKMKYRLVRHEILMNVNDCLSLEGTCNVANEETEEYGVDVTVKNLNQTHHLYKVDANIGDLFLYCEKFALNNEKIYFINNSMNEYRDAELSPGESINIRCIIKEKPDEIVLNPSSSSWDKIRRKFSNHKVKNIDEITTSDVLQMSWSSNFLIRNEAKYFPFSQQNITNEDLLEVLNANNKHLTLCVNWKATISDNGRVLRTALGQHFVQIEKIFETSHCPLRGDVQTFLSSNSISIFDYVKQQEKIKLSTKLFYWAENNSITSRRCFLESI